MPLLQQNAKFPRIMQIINAWLVEGIGENHGCVCVCLKDMQKRKGISEYVKSSRLTEEQEEVGRVWRCEQVSIKLKEKGKEWSP